jgi:hypothetical protein
MDCAVAIKDGRPVGYGSQKGAQGRRYRRRPGREPANGVYTDLDAFQDTRGEGDGRSFAFRTGKSRETSYSREL